MKNTNTLTFLLSLLISFIAGAQDCPDNYVKLDGPIVLKDTIGNSKQINLSDLLEATPKKFLAITNPRITNLGLLKRTQTHKPNSCELIGEIINFVNSEKAGELYPKSIGPTLEIIEKNQEENQCYHYYYTYKESKFEGGQRIQTVDVPSSSNSNLRNPTGTVSKKSPPQSTANLVEELLKSGIYFCYFYMPTSVSTPQTDPK